MKYPGTSREKTLNDKLINIPNDDKLDNPSVNQN